MKTIRRLYFYVVAFISIEVVLWGMIGLLRSILNPQDVSDNASNLAQALALILVGVPIFLIHWSWSQRVSARDAEENSVSIRAIFLYGILLGTLIPVVQNLLALINRAFLSTANLYTYRAVVGGTQSWLDNLIAILINLLIAAYFWNVLKSNWKSLTETENFAEIRRLYRFVWVVYGLFITAYGAQQALTYIFTLPSNVLGQIGREIAVNATALLVIGTPIWVFSWRIVQDALADSAEKESYLRLGILYLLALGGVIVSLVAGGNLIYMILMQILGEGKDWAEFFQKIGGPISVGVPFGVIWAYYGKWLSQQFAFDENAPRRAGKQRLFSYILSLLGLGATVFGMISLFSVMIDLMLGESYLSESGFQEPLSGVLATLAVGLPLWLMTWRTVQTQALETSDAGDHARRSVIRKSYLYFVLFVAVIGGMIAAGTLVFNLINTALGSSLSGVLKDVLNEFLQLGVFVVLLLYHLFALRKDGAARADVLAEKQAQFKVLIFDQDGKFGESVRAVFAKRASDVPVTVVNVSDGIPADLKAEAVILPGSLAVNTSEKLEAWLRSFHGNKLIVSDEAAGVFWMSDFEQAADSAKAMAEGQDVRPRSTKRSTPVWMYVAYVFAALFALQVLLMLMLFGISMVTGF